MRAIQCRKALTASFTSPGMVWRKGYDGQPELNAQFFLSEPGVPGGRMFRTGDLVRSDAQGQLFLLGAKIARSNCAVIVLS